MKERRGAVSVILIISLFLLALLPGPGCAAVWGSPEQIGGGPPSPGFFGPGSAGGGAVALYEADARPVSEAEARERLETYAKAFGPEVEVRDFTPFTQNYYAVLVDRATGLAVGEAVVDRYTGEAGPDPGPALTWRRSVPNGAATYDLHAAEAIAATFLEEFLPGATLLENRTFPGYHTFEYGRGEIEGMLSVNDRTGQVWVHTWHGQYIGGEEEGGHSGG
ncbi:peptidase M4 [Methanofollis formosanus]|uniref:Peptidase M4 n=1 Tax=Methanofollis formosanus TaxID=299308 RepID=A0A8G1A134_9EURY|nr:hypothetical protein [Methanofollis formosanus]QYZ78147.1 peptidase M4 [Methanofollis formosanus]